MINTSFYLRILDDHEYYGIRDTKWVYRWWITDADRGYMGKMYVVVLPRKDDTWLILERQVIRAEEKGSEGIPGRGKTKHEVCKTISLIWLCNFRHKAIKGMRRKQMWVFLSLWNHVNKVNKLTLKILDINKNKYNQVREVNKLSNKMKHIHTISNIFQHLFLDSYFLV